jgi:hypothetical protein
MNATAIGKAHNFRTDAKIFELSEPFTFDGHTSRYVVRSYGMELFGSQYGVFLTDGQGKVLSWLNIAEWESDWDPPDWVFHLD